MNLDHQTPIVGDFERQCIWK